MKPHRALKETLLALALVAFGLILFPAMIFYVGQQLIGEYEEGLLGFYEAIAAALAGGNGFAWVLILSPYLGVLLIRFGFWLRRQRKAVN